jgi:hypothetical protein
MTHRNFRIAWSVAWGVVAVLLFALYLRSGSWDDKFGFKFIGGRYIVFGSSFRKLTIDVSIQAPPSSFRYAWRMQSRRIAPSTFVDYPTIKSAGYVGALGFGYGRFPLLSSVIFPHWFVAIVAVVLAAVPYYFPRLRWRFNLRTLLIATTLVALLLGIIVWMSRAGG